MSFVVNATQIKVYIKSVAGSGSSLQIAFYPCLIGGHVYKCWCDVSYALKLIDCTLKGTSANA